MNDEIMHVGGYTLLKRHVSDKVEIWDYWSDRLIHVVTTWREAVDWAFAHSQIPRVPERCWPSEYPDGERPKSFKGA